MSARPHVPCCRFYKLATVVQRGVVRAGLTDDLGAAYAEESPNTTARWVAPVDPVTGKPDTRLCFLYADMWRRVIDPGSSELEPLQAWVFRGGAATADEGRVGAIQRERVAPEVYDAVLGSVLMVLKRLDLGYDTSEEGGRCVNGRKRVTLSWDAGIR